MEEPGRRGAMLTYIDHEQGVCWDLEMWMLGVRYWRPAGERDFDDPLTHFPHN